MRAKIADVSSLRAEELQQVRKQTGRIISTRFIDCVSFFGERAWLDKTLGQFTNKRIPHILLLFLKAHIGLAMGIGCLARVVQVFSQPVLFILIFL